ncbi:MAG: 16S rRNA (guanine(966)-N(2))-methyltransferase RsmD [Candidatus Omnitrophica bacterium]|nr:16S rRNA (guanine(966)-N(2))-methyltransferase RsmD [Candidatus Omnitrophota bacterium]
MRVTGGVWRSRRLIFPRRADIRPTRDMVRKAVFDVLRDAVAGQHVLDAFSGSGAFGFDALSRNAASAVFVDSRQECAQAISENAAALNAAERCTVLREDVFSALELFARQKKMFSLVFADPPYQQGIAKKFLMKLGACAIVIAPAFVVIEHHARDQMPENMERFVRRQYKEYGNTAVSFYGPAV